MTTAHPPRRDSRRRTRATIPTASVARASGTETNGRTRT